jgi:hypothetical protein
MHYILILVGLALGSTFAVNLGHSREASLWRILGAAFAWGLAGVFFAVGPYFSLATVIQPGEPEHLKVYWRNLPFWILPGLFLASIDWLFLRVTQQGLNRS